MTVTIACGAAGAAGAGAAAAAVSAGGASAALSAGLLQAAANTIEETSHIEDRRICSLQVRGLRLCTHECLLGHIRGTALPPYRLTALPPHRLARRGEHLGVEAPRVERPAALRAREPHLGRAEQQGVDLVEIALVALEDLVERHAVIA